MMYLETYLKSVTERADVLVKLSSFTTYGIGQTDNPITMQDGCGNHHTRNWADAIAEGHLYGIFVVDKVECLIEEWRDKPQYVVTLKNEKSEATCRLDTLANRMACSRYLGGVF